MTVEDRFHCGKCGQQAEPDEFKGNIYCGVCDWYTNWPPTGKHAEVWKKVESFGLTDEEKEILSIVAPRWVFENSTLVAQYDPETGVWEDFEPDWTQPKDWLEGGG